VSHRPITSTVALAVVILVVLLGLKPAAFSRSSNPTRQVVTSPQLNPALLHPGGW